MSSILLATDLDDTLVGDDEATLRLNKLLAPLRDKGELKLVYVTGRSFELYTQLKQEKSLLEPDAVITDIGTEVYINNEKSQGWPTVSGWNRQQLVNILSMFPQLTPQPNTEQRPYKISYFLEENTQLVDEIRESLKDYPVGVSYSMERYLDVLPINTNKGSALGFLAEKWKIAQTNVFACGDSGNDISMLSISNAILVGNAKDELLVWSNSRSHNIYKSHDSYADGIIEALRHYQVLE